jgi:hypothetical protein
MLLLMYFKNAILTLRFVSPKIKPLPSQKNIYFISYIYIYIYISIYLSIYIYMMGKLSEYPYCISGCCSHLFQKIGIIPIIQLIIVLKLLLAFLVEISDF